MLICKRLERVLQKKTNFAKKNAKYINRYANTEIYVYNFNNECIYLI